MACHTVWISSPFVDNVHSRYYTPRMRCGPCCAWYNPCGICTDSPYWPVRSIDRKYADEHAWLCLTSHIRVVFAVRLWYYCIMSILVFSRYVACSVSKSFCFHSNGQHSLPPLKPRLRYGCWSNNSDHVIHQCGAWSLGRLVSCRHLFFCFYSFCGYVAFVLRSTATPAVRITVRTLYSKLTCKRIRIVAWTCPSCILCSYSSLLVCCRCAVRLRKDYRLNGVPLVCA